MAPSITEEHSGDQRSPAISPAPADQGNNSGSSLMWSEGPPVSPLNITTSDYGSGAGSPPLSPSISDRPPSEGQLSVCSSTVDPSTSVPCQQFSQLSINTEVTEESPQFSFYNSADHDIILQLVTGEMVHIPAGHGIVGVPPFHGQHPALMLAESPPHPGAWMGFHPGTFAYPPPGFAAPFSVPTYPVSGPPLMLTPQAPAVAAPAMLPLPPQAPLPPLTPQVTGAQGVPRDSVVVSPSVVAMPPTNDTQLSGRSTPAWCHSSDGGRSTCSPAAVGAEAAVARPNLHTGEAPTTVLFATAPCGVLNEANISTSYPDSVSQCMEVVWHGEFTKNFRSFPDHWELKPCDNPPAAKEQHHWNYFKDSAKVRFMCQKCGNAWTSMKGRCMFWFAIDKEEKLGGVLFKLYGQACHKCHPDDGTDDSPVEFSSPMWYPEEVVKVIGNVYNRIGQFYYGFTSPPLNMNRRQGNPREHHNSRRCQACSEGVCRFEWLFSHKVAE